MLGLSLIYSSKFISDAIIKFKFRRSSNDPKKRREEKRKKKFHYLPKKVFEIDSTNIIYIKNIYEKIHTKFFVKKIINSKKNFLCSSVK